MKPVSPADLERGRAIYHLRLELTLSRGQFANIMGVDKRTVLRWEHGSTQPTGPSQLLFEALERAWLALGADNRARNKLRGQLNLIDLNGGFAHIAKQAFALGGKEKKQ